MMDGLSAPAALNRIIEKAWSDPEFKAKLLADGNAALKDVGADVQDGVTVKVLENTDTVLHFRLPARPPEAELDDAALADLAAGSGFGSVVRASFTHMIEGGSFVSTAAAKGMSTGAKVAAGAAGVTAAGGIAAGLSFGYFGS